MKTFKSYLNASVAEDRNQFHIIVIGDAKDIEHTEESIWAHSGTMDYWKRVEKPNAADGKVHLHLARQKHIKTKAREIAWHVNGGKHDKRAFNNNLNGVESARTIAKTILKLPAERSLELVANENAATFLAGIEYLPNKCKIFVFEIAENQE